ncbi:MAG TPA: hypothetical protein VFE78_03830 [Gemmataceae bacterium]|jgi:hypothetical protein|nr:hypothetical protein [Gemmataceae bacterium]
MFRFLGMMIWLPGEMFFSGMGAMLQSMREMQRAFNRGVAALAGDPARTGGGGQAGEAGRGGRQADNWDGPRGERVGMTSTKEETAMSDYNGDGLSGDGLKFVSYAILFTKPDLEHTLEEKKQEVLNYSTDPGSFGGLKIAEFMKKVERKEVERPQLWKDNDYPPGARGDRDWEIPEEDKKFITFTYRIERCLPKQETEYEKEKVRELRKIRTEIEKTRRAIGP